MDSLTRLDFNRLMTNRTKPNLILGGTGKTGRRVADRLETRGLPIRVGSRAGRPPFDWEDRSTWAPATAGVGAAYVSYFPDLAIPGAAETVADFARHAVAAGVDRLVMLSGRGEPEAQRAEAGVQQSGAEWTIVRASWFNQNFSESYLLEPILAGEVALPVDGVPEPFVDADDIADVVVAALTEERHAGEVYEVTGPRALTFAEAVSEIRAASGRDIRFTPVALEDYAAAMTDDGVPGDVVWLLRYLFTEVLDGRNAHVTDGIVRALGREPREFADYARATAAAGVWRAP